MKKLLLLLVCLTVIAGLIIGCAGEKEEETEDQTSETQTQEDDADDDQADTGNVETDEDADED